MKVPRFSSVALKNTQLNLKPDQLFWSKEVTHANHPHPQLVIKEDGEENECQH